MAVAKPQRGDQNWDVSLNAKLDDLDLTVPGSANALAASGTYRAITLLPSGGDDAPALYAALLAAPARTELFLGKGTWKLNSAQGSAPVDSQGNARALLYLTGKTDLRITADPDARFTTDLTVPATMLEVRDSTRVDVVGLRIQWNNLTNGLTDNNSNISGSAVRFTNVDGGSIRDCDISLCGYSAIYLTAGTSRVSVRGNYLHELGLIGPANANGINEDSIAGTVGGAQVAPADNSITGNRILNCRGSGAICLDNGGFKTNTLVANNTIDNPTAGFASTSYQGIRCHDVSAVQIIGNTVRNTLREGIYVDSTGPSMAAVGIESNVVDTCGTGGYDGIRVDNLGNGELRGFGIIGNVVRNCGGCGINLASSGVNSVRDGVVNSNVVMDNDRFNVGTADGIRILGRRVQVLGNTVVATTSAHRYCLQVVAGSTLVFAPYNILIGGLSGTLNDGSSSITHFWDTENQQVFSFGSGYKIQAGAAGTVPLQIGSTAPSVDQLQAKDGATIKARLGSDYIWRTVAGFRVETSVGGSVVFSVESDGKLRWRAATNEQTTVGAAGAASALPATPTKYLKVLDSAGTTLVIPAYAAS